MTRSRRNILISGAANGIGRACAFSFHNAGWQVIATDKDTDKLSELQQPGMLAIPMDVTSPHSIDGVRSKLQREKWQLDALISNAGTFDQFPLAEDRDQQLERLMSLNVLGTHRLVNAFFPLLYPGKGRIAIISSETGYALLPFQTYGLSKKMLDDYTAVLRQELSLVDMPVITIRPGAHQTQLLKRSAEIITNVPPESRFRKALQAIYQKALPILNKKNPAPDAVAATVLQALTAKQPKHEYHVNISFRFKLMRHLPPYILSSIIRRELR